MEQSIIFLGIIILVVGAGVGFFLGFLMANLKKFLYAKKLEKNALEVIHGKRKNQMMNLDGKIIDVNKFLLPNENGNFDIVKLDELKQNIPEKKGLFDKFKRKVNSEPLKPVESSKLEESPKNKEKKAIGRTALHIN